MASIIPVICANYLRNCREMQQRNNLYRKEMQKKASKRNSKTKKDKNKE